MQYVTIPCPTCGTRLDERVAEAAFETRCPDCHRPVRIPARSELPPVAPHPAAAPEPEVYALRADEGASNQSGPSARAKSEPRRVLAVCGVCGCRIHPPQRKSAYKVRCPDCHRPIAVPAFDAAAERVQPPPAPAQETAEPAESFLLPPIVRTSRPPRLHYALQTAQLPHVERDPPPQWTWFSGVWTFPWQPRVLKKWLWLSFGGGLLGLFAMAAMFTGSVGMSQSPVSGVLLAFFALPAIWISLWTAAYGASACAAVITETAAGNQTVHDWPEQGWREGMFLVLQWGYVVFLDVLLAHVAGWCGARLGMPYWTVFPIVFRALLPYLVLSVLETGAWYAPFSGPVTRSLVTNVVDWIICCALLELVLRGGNWLWAQTIGRWLIPALLLGGPLAAAQALIAARLLGRLGWRITQSAPEVDVATPES